jgi:hypothetical protein
LFGLVSQDKKPKQALKVRQKFDVLVMLTPAPATMHSTLSPFRSTTHSQIIFSHPEGTHFVANLFLLFPQR